MERDDAVWYYRLGGRTLGPVSWRDVEEITRDTLDAEHLLVARGGEDRWRSAADVIAEDPERAEPAEVREAAEEPEPPRPAEAPRPVETPRPAGAAAAAAAQAAPPPDAVAGAEEFVPEHGLGKWIGQAWEMVIKEIWAWVGGLLLLMLVAAVTLGITGPPLTAGLYMMALKRYRGEQIGAASVFDGFSRFASSWGLALVMAVPMLLLMAPLMILIAIPAIMAQGGGAVEDIAVAFTAGIYLLMPFMWLLVMAVQTIFFYSWVLVADGHGAWESVTMSWEKVGKRFWSYLGTFLVLSILASIGSYACYVGWLLTYPLLPCAQVAAYMWHFRRV